MPATPAWLASAEAMFNRGIGDSAQAAALARNLEGTSLLIEVTGIATIRAAVYSGRLALLAAETTAAPAAAQPLDVAAAATGAGGPAGAGGTAGAAGAANAAISGTLPALLQLLKAGSGAVKGPPGRGAQVRGDAEIANRYRELFMLARPDPEEELSRWIGDLPARRLSQFAAAALEAARRIHRTAGENIAEYLQEEGRDLVNKTELEEFLRGVDHARDIADRIEARLLRLEQRIRGAA